MRLNLIECCAVCVQCMYKYAFSPYHSLSSVFKVFNEKWIRSTGEVRAYAIIALIPNEFIIIIIIIESHSQLAHKLSKLHFCRMPLIISLHNFPFNSIRFNSFSYRRYYYVYTNNIRCITCSCCLTSYRVKKKFTISLFLLHCEVCAVCWVTHVINNNKNAK